MLVIYGSNDFPLRDPAREDLLSRYQSHASVSRLVLPNEGHFIQRRGNIDQILRRLDAFLTPSLAPKDKSGGAIPNHP